MSELSEFQKEVGEWGDKTFNSKRACRQNDNARAILAHLKKEREEVEFVIDASELAGNKYLLAANLDNPGNIGQEVADCFLLLLHLSHLYKFDLLDEARKKMEINYKRKWGEPDEDGVIEHI